MKTPEFSFLCEEILLPTASWINVIIHPAIAFVKEWRGAGGVQGQPKIIH